MVKMYKYTYFKTHLLNLKTDLKDHKIEISLLSYSKASFYATFFTETLSDKR